MKRSIRIAVSAGALLALLNSTSVRADQNVVQTFSQPIHTTVNIDESGCQNHPGPTITVNGAIVLGGVQLRLIFQNNVKGTHTTEVTWSGDFELIPLGKSISIPKQPSQGGVGGNPYIWIQFFNKKGNQSDEIFLGRCVQGLKLGNDFLNDSIVELLLSFLGCNNHPGPVITIGGNMHLDGLSAKLIFRNNLKGTHTAQAATTVKLIQDGTILTIPKSPHQGGSGGNPLVYVQVLHGNGDPASNVIFLGRCNKL